MRTLRGLLLKTSAPAMVGWAWAHRGTVLRTVDALRRVPSHVTTGQVGRVVAEARVIARLDRHFARDRRVRIESVGDGELILGDGVDAADLAALRTDLLPLSGVVELRTDVAHQPTLDQALAGV